MSDTLHQEPERDQFKSESPIRAFTDWQVNGRYALGKGFRPSLQHVVPYLEAMERKEGWRVVQVLEAGTQTPSFLFRLEREPSDDELRERYSHLDTSAVLPERSYVVRGKITLDDVDAFLKEQGLALVSEPDGNVRMYRVEDDRASTFPMEYAMREEDGTVTITRVSFDAMPEWLLAALPNFGIEVPYIRNREGFEEAGRKIDQARDMAADMVGDDPVNPKHYGGTACAEIGELLTANSYQVLKYNWRLGEKDEPCQEIDKSLWYLDREIALIAEGHTFIPGDHRLPDHTFFDRRLDGRSEHTKEVARKLISWNRYGKVETLKLLRKLLQDKRSTFTCDDIGRGLAL